MPPQRDKPLQVHPGDSTAGSSRTNWKAIADAGSDSLTAGQSRDQVARRYFGVIMAYVRRSGIAAAEAEDVTQGFICDVMLGRNLLAAAQPERGRFRSLLLTSVRNYVFDELRKRTAATRKPDSGWVVPLDGATRETHSDSPEQAFQRAWVAMLIEQASKDLHAFCMANGQESSWDIFDRRVLQPMRTGAAPVTTEAFMKQWSLSAPSQVANILVRMKRRFTASLMAQLGHFDEDCEAVCEEASALLRACSGGST